MSAVDVRELLADHVLGLLAPDEAARVEAALAASPELQAEAEGLRGALYAVPMALEPAPLAPGAWEGLLARVRAADGADGEVPGAAPAGAALRAPRTAPGAPAQRALPPGAMPPGAAADPGWRARRTRRLSLAVAAAVLLLGGSVAWGLLLHQRVALQAHEQAVVAYWMRIPGMQVVPLETPDGAVAGVHPGVVCVLPDGRAMVLQPHPAPGGAGYVLYGDTGTGQVELGRTSGTLIEFHADGLQGVEVAIPGPRGGVVAKASLQ